MVFLSHMTTQGPSLVTFDSQVLGELLELLGVARKEEQQLPILNY